MDTTYLRKHYDQLETRELLKLRATDLASEAREVLEAELAARTAAGETEPALTAADTAQSMIDPACLAKLWERLLAKVLDFVTVVAVVFAIDFPVFFYAPRDFAQVVDYACVTLLFAYIFFKDGFNGQSVGKRLLKIRAVEYATGAPCRLPRSFIRNLVGWLGPIDWVFALGKERRRLGDYAAGTSVVKA